MKYVNGYVINEINQQALKSRKGIKIKNRH